jgi:hypothetical protein
LVSNRVKASIRPDRQNDRLKKMNVAGGEEGISGSNNPQAETTRLVGQGWEQRLGNDGFEDTRGISTLFPWSWTTNTVLGWSHTVQEGKIRKPDI